MAKVGKMLGGKGKGIGTDVAEYSSAGPFYCGMCIYVKGINAGEIYEDSKGMGRCDQRNMVADPQVKKDGQGRPIVNIDRGCCRYVHPITPKQ